MNAGFNSQPRFVKPTASAIELVVFCTLSRANALLKHAGRSDKRIDAGLVDEQPLAGSQCVANGVLRIVQLRTNFAHAGHAG